MNNQSPFVPNDSLEQRNNGRARVKIAVFFVLAVHGVGLMALLIGQAGCRQQTAPTPDENATPPTSEITSNNPPEAITPPPPPTAISNPPPVVVPPPVTPPPAQTTEYTVVDGDTPAGIAKNFKIKLQALLDANPGLKPTAMHIGDKLHIPAPALTPPAGTPPSVTSAPSGSQATEYTVVDGDTPAGIAKNFKIKLQALLDANPGLKPTAMHIGDKLHIPAAAAPAGGAPSPSAPAPSESSTGNTYKVKSGDNLTSVAKAHGTTVRELRSANNLTTDLIRVGQELKIPAKAAAPAGATPPADSSSATPPAGSPGR